MPDNIGELSLTDDRTKFVKYAIALREFDKIDEFSNLPGASSYANSVAMKDALRTNQGITGIDLNVERNKAIAGIPKPNIKATITRETGDDQEQARKVVDSLWRHGFAIRKRRYAANRRKNRPTDSRTKSPKKGTPKK